MTVKRYGPLALSVAAHLTIPLLLSSFLVESSRFALASSSTQGFGPVSVELVAPRRVQPVQPAVEAAVPAPPVVREVPKVTEPLPKKHKPERVQKKKEVVPPQSKVTDSPANEAAQAAAPTQADSIGAGVAADTISATPDYLRNPAPLYPHGSRLAGESGAVLLSVSLTAEGDVSALQIKESSGFSRLDEAALRAVKSWKFTPARVAGIAIASSIQVPVRFVLRS